MVAIATESVDSTLSSDSNVRPKMIHEFRKHSGSVLSGLFGAAAFDEVALVPVAAAVDRTRTCAVARANASASRPWSTTRAPC